MIDRMLEVGGIFDWISPLGSLVQTTRGWTTIKVWLPEGWSGRDVESILGDYEIPISWPQIINGWAVFNVRRGHAKVALQILDFQIYGYSPPTTFIAKHVCAVKRDWVDEFEGLEDY